MAEEKTAMQASRASHNVEAISANGGGRGQDEALEMAGEHSHDVDPAVSARALKKIDWVLIPAMVAGYSLVYYDKAILGAAVLFGMTTDLSLSVTDADGKTDTTRLSWATSLFYFGMLAGVYPMTYALQTFNLGRILGGVVILWALICMLTAAVTSFQGLYAQRFFLGFVESIIPTGFMTIISGFYTQKEQSMRQSWWVSSNCWFTIAGGALNYGFAQIKGGGLEAWQYIYLLAGSLTFVFGLICFAVPNGPTSAWFLTKDERLAAAERLRKGQTGTRCSVLKKYQIVEALCDVKTWLVFIIMASIYTVNGAVTGFGPLIVKTFGWSVLESILWQFPLGGIGLVAVLGSGWLGSRFQDIRLVMLVISCLPIIAGFIMIWKSEWYHHAPVPVAGYSLIGFFAASVGLCVTVGMSNVAGHTKKSFVAATIFVAYATGNIIGPLMVKSQTKEEHYPELWTGLTVCYCITISASITLYFVLRRANKTKYAAGEGDEDEREKLAFQDLTDMENPYFRYSL
ncbi:hypothetical protein MKZ38_000766 [Zalerion maritima]|uniref:Major facilitator superfamily (MFS) profile domain-containing protein n=1 Tax=Zalerion maritima TaxID=339359 RepID=A0AAD5WRW1_9PEZI|nr:hypothetical protein MKZ38_000766 [Zalerion maritima]